MHEEDADLRIAVYLIIRPYLMNLLGRTTISSRARCPHGIPPPEQWKRSDGSTFTIIGMIGSAVDPQ